MIVAHLQCALNGLIGIWSIDLPSNLGTVPSDPDEVDLSSLPSVERSSVNVIEDESQIGANMRSLLRAGAPPPGANIDSGIQDADGDQMMKLLSQLMSGMPPDFDRDEYASKDVPSGLASMLGGAGAMPGLGGNHQANQGSSYEFVWKIVHAFFALSLGVYITATSNVSFGNMKRDPSGEEYVKASERNGVNLFFAFATAELMLQSSRMFLERGGSEGMLGGWMSLVAGFLPEPWRGYMRLFARYAKIWATIVEDAMVVVFVVGCIAWSQGAVR